MSSNMLGIKIPPFCLIALKRDKTSSPSRGEDRILHIEQIVQMGAANDGCC